MKERIAVQTSMLGIAKKAKSDKRYRFRNLYRELNEELLLDSWRLLRKDAALGVTIVSETTVHYKATSMPCARITGRAVGPLRNFTNCLAAFGTFELALIPALNMR